MVAIATRYRAVSSRRTGELNDRNGRPHHFLLMVSFFLRSFSCDSGSWTQIVAGTATRMPIVGLAIWRFGLHPKCHDYIGD